MPDQQANRDSGPSAGARPRSRPNAWGVTGIAAALALALTGCNYITPLAYAIHGPGEVPAAYELRKEHKDSTLAILVDDPSSTTSRSLLRTTIAETAQSRIVKKKLVARVVSARSVLNASIAPGPDGKPLPVDEIGRRVGADLIVYVGLLQFDPIGTDTQGPGAAMSVKLIEPATGKRVWPEEPEGYRLLASLPNTGGSFTRNGRLTPGQLFEAESALAAKAGLALAELFYDVERTLSNRTN